MLGNTGYLFVKCTQECQWSQLLGYQNNERPPVCEMSAKVTITVTDTGFWNFCEKFTVGGRELLLLPLNYFKMDMAIAKLTTGGLFLSYYNRKNNPTGSKVEMFTQ